MRNNKYRNKHVSRILATLLIVCVFLAMFSGCTFGSSDTCTDPNCTSCSHVVYAEEYTACSDPECLECDEVAVISSTYVDCPDCTLGGEYVVSTRVCTTCEGDGIITGTTSTTCGTCLGTGIGVSYVECVACGGDGVFVCPVCEGLRYYTVYGENICCENCGGNGLKVNASEAVLGTGTVDCANCVDGYYTSSRCGDCSGNGVIITYYSYICPNTACNDGVITTTTWVECQTCYGEKGWYVEDGQEECSYCGYAGLMTCPDCLGYGYITLDGENYGCITCGGNGQRMNGATAVAGSGTLACPYCTDSVYYTVSFICVDLDGYGFDNYSVTVEGDDTIPDIFGWSSDTYYLASNESGTNVIPSNTQVTSDMTIYVHITEISTNYSVKYYTLRYGGAGAYYYSEYSDTISHGTTLYAYVADDFYDGLLQSNSDRYEQIGWYVSYSDLGLSYSVVNSYLDYFDVDDVCNLSDYTVNSDMHLYAVYELAEEYSSALDELVDSNEPWINFDFDTSGIVNVLLIIGAVIICLIALFLILRLIIALFK